MQTITVEGFDYGIDVVGGMVANAPVFEHITLKDQLIAGFRNQVSITSIRDLVCTNPNGPAILGTDNRGHLIITDCRLQGGTSSNASIEVPNDCQSLFARRIDIDGFGNKCIKKGNQIVKTGDLTEEYVAGNRYELHGSLEARSLDLLVEDAPIVPYDPPEKWVSVESKGAKGNVSTDDTQAIQAAMDDCDGTNKTTVYFRGTGEYKITGSVDIPSTVKRLVFMWGGRINSKSLSSSEGVFRINGPASSPLVIEDYFQHVNGNTGYFVEHASSRTLILRNLRGSRDYSNYKHTSGKRKTKLFLENVAHTISEGCDFDNQCWARWVNTEGASEVEFFNPGGVLWVLGFKCEAAAINFKTTNGGFTEVLGGVINQYSGGWATSNPAFQLIDAHGSLVATLESAV